MAKKDKASVKLDIKVEPKNNAQPSQKKSKKKNKGSKKQRQKAVAGKSGYFIEAMMYPDLVGPVRFPLAGCVDKTVLACDRLRFDIVGNSTNVCQVIGVTTNVSSAISARNYVSTTLGGNWTTGANQGPGLQFPPIAAWQDARLTSCSVVGYYSGTALNATGEVLIGTLPENDALGYPDFSTTSYQTMYYMPEMIHCPVAQTINEPVRAAGFHQSPASWEFVSVNSTVPDMNLPFIAVYGLTNGTSFTVEITRCWEIRSALAAPNAIPYESSSEGRSADEAAFTNASDFISHLATTVSEAVPNILNGAVGLAFEAIPTIARSTSRALLGHVTNRMFANVQSGQTNRIQYY